jgi:nicotinamide-nucleotide amidase
MIHEMLTLGDIGRYEIRMATLEAALNMIRAQI